MSTTRNNDERSEFLSGLAAMNILDKPMRRAQIDILKEGGQAALDAALLRPKKKNNRRHKGARQVMSDETKRINAILEQEQQQYEENPEYVRRVPHVTCFNVSAPPSVKPVKHYCDITGLSGPYTSPTNNIRYHNSEIYQFIVKPMAPGVDQEYLKLRGANFVLK